MSDSIYEKVIYENVDKGYELRLVLNEFKDNEYLHIRKYFMSYDEGYLPSREGIAMKASIANVFALLDGLIEICALEEGRDAVTKHLEDRLSRLNEQGTRIPEPGGS